MIRYALKCADDHRFESWFQSADAFDTLAGLGHVACPTCGGTDVAKAVMAPRVAKGEPSTAARAPTPTVPERPLQAPSHPHEQMLKALREHVEKNSTYVGRDFATQARAMHVGERPPGTIHGEASTEEVKSLLEDGVPVAPLPFPGGGSRN